MKQYNKNFLILLSCIVLSVFTISFVSAMTNTIYLQIKGNAMSAALKNISLEEIFNKIKQKKEIEVIANTNLLKDKISLNFKNLSFQEGLKRILKGKNVSFIFNKKSELIKIMIFDQSKYIQLDDIDRNNVSGNTTNNTLVEGQTPGDNVNVSTRSPGDFKSGMSDLNKNEVINNEVPELNPALQNNLPTKSKVNPGSNGPGDFKSDKTIPSPVK